MKFKIATCFALLFALAAPLWAQDVGRVMPASLPLPLPGAVALAPDVLRAKNPWNLPMTGTWKFELTHGKIINVGEFAPAPASKVGLTASSQEERNPSDDAFDGRAETRWCASDASVPQWLQTDLGADQKVGRVSVTWEKADAKYQCRIEGRKQGGTWQTLLDATAAPGIGNGDLTFPAATVRTLRLTVVGHPDGSWASIRELQIHLDQNGKDVIWQPLTGAAPAGAARADEFAKPGFDDAAWDDVAVPSNWEILGYSAPTYGWVDNTVGQYRRLVNVPASWAGRKIYWHFDGALDGAEVWVNGQKAGYHESGYTAWDVDLTGLVKPGQRNLFAVRVSKSTPSSDAETGDYQCMGGIYRDTSLFAVPQTHVSDITVQTPLAPNYRDATLGVALAIAGMPGQTVAIAGDLVSARTGQVAGVTLAGQTRIGANGTGALQLSAPVSAPALWSAEKPELYYVVMRLSSGGKTVETVEQRFGFKQIEFKDNAVLWNGRPIKCAGVCRHDFWADRGFALTEANWQRDIALMKAANINAIRTSHYNHAQRFLELCEEHGFYVLDEVPYCWIGDQVKDPAWAPYLLQRARETLARDKNRPCVLAWSLGNENPVGQNSQAVFDLVHALDPTRLAFVSQNQPSDVQGQKLLDSHYPDPGWVSEMAAKRIPAILSENPHIFWQPWSTDYDEGVHDLWSEVMLKEWDVIWDAPTIVGSFIWEWQNQGIADKAAPAPHIGPWGPDNLRQENDKGIVTAFRVPKPEWWTVKQVYSPIQVATAPLVAGNGQFSVPISNRYSFTDLSEITCRWTALKGQTALQSGTQKLSCAPGARVAARLPAPAGATVLRLEFARAGGGELVAFNLPVAGAPAVPAPAALPAKGALAVADGAQTLEVSNALQKIRFDKSSGTLQGWSVRGREIANGGPILNLGEAKADDEHKDYYRAPNAPVTANATVSAAAPAADGTVRVTAVADVTGAPGGAALGTLTTTYDIQTDAQITVNWSLKWSAADARLWEAGLKISLPADLTRMRWSREAYFTDYPAGHIGEPSGGAGPQDVQFRASKRKLHWLSLTDAAGFGVALLPVGETPLIARANTRAPMTGGAAGGTTLFASRAVAGLQDFSGSWTSQYDIAAKTGQTIEGAFTLRALAP